MQSTYVQNNAHVIDVCIRKRPRRLENRMIFFNAIKYHVHWNMRRSLTVILKRVHTHIYMHIFASFSFPDFDCARCY